MTSVNQWPGPHANQPVVSTGAALDRAAFAVVMIHGRGGSAQDMLGLAEHLALPSVAWLAPVAGGRAWLAPLSQSIQMVTAALARSAVLRAAHARESGFVRWPIACGADRRLQRH